VDAVKEHQALGAVHMSRLARYNKVVLHVRLALLTFRGALSFFFCVLDGTSIAPDGDGASLMASTCWKTL